MEIVGAYEAKTHLPRLLDRVARGESLIITRHGRPVAQLTPVATERELAEKAAGRIMERRKRLTRAPLAELMASVHEGHKY
ncbi:MAG: type II toxin-antitoxin system prevent-host-death family antitoxin [Gammaproteobacteria bacterium]|nr:type II toxin-antitoxin system prevent-host-death family antitoxin [Gammaproteobacteria bacterium]MYD03290.1 type II toxin-antitoxin system prevent-host-death family antitoxin [Gammaproteobacteria bacterium]MYI24174.1 type II toxin-antitoxin system prevent-host-death family antitoxin [Gammaproteobacteria bacterium]